MSQPHSTRQQGGFALINALFLLVVLAFLGVVMVTLSGVQSRTPLFALLGARTYHAARSGIEWGTFKALNGSCAAANTTLTIDGATVVVTCQSAPFTEGASTYNVYRLSAFAKRGSYGATDYISRRIEARVTGP